MAGMTEIERGRSEAAHTLLKAVDIRPYLNPPSDTPLPLAYAFFLIGEIRGKTVLDLGCGSGENTVPLLARGAKVVAVDLSPELIRLARNRITITRQKGECQFVVGSAYDVPLPDETIDVVLCASLLHHLAIPRAMAEIKRVLKPEGVAIVKEPVRFSRTYAMLRKLFPEREDISEDEHPLTQGELEHVKEGWIASGERSFRLPMIPALQRVVGEKRLARAWPLDRWLLKHFRAFDHFATTRVVKLQKPAASHSQMPFAAA